MVLSVQLECSRLANAFNDLLKSICVLSDARVSVFVRNDVFVFVFVSVVQSGPPGLFMQ